MLYGSDQYVSITSGLALQTSMLRVWSADRPGSPRADNARGDSAGQRAVGKI